MQCLFGGTMFGTSEMTPTAEGKMLAGNYLVSVKLGGDAAGQTFVSAESSRGLLSPTATAAGQSLDFGFVVNVREMEGQPKHAGGPSGYPGLNLFFSGPSDMPPQVSAIGYALAGAETKPLMVYVAGDSTVCDQSGNEFGGWAQMLPQHFAAPVGISNYANSGASSNFGFWNDIKDHWVAGDWVIIQFGHNDKNSTDAQVQANLERMVSDALAAKVTPILVSPPARAQFDGAMVGNQSSLHAASAAAAAASKKVAYIDLTKLSTAWYNELGSKAEALKFHAHGTDATHTNLAGADKLAALVAADIRTQNLELAKYLR
jgi:lysophospholipase L1-like esterase